MKCEEKAEQQNRINEKDKKEVEWFAKIQSQHETVMGGRLTVGQHSVIGSGIIVPATHC